MQVFKTFAYRPSIFWLLLKPELESWWFRPKKSLNLATRNPKKICFVGFVKVGSCIGCETWKTTGWMGTDCYTAQMSWVQKWLSRMLISITPNLVSCHGFSVSLSFSNGCAAKMILQLIWSHVYETRSSCPNAVILFMNSLGRWWREWITFFSSSDVWTFI